MARILLIDQNTPRRNDILLTLAKAGHHVFVVSESQRAFQILDSQETRPEIIMMYLPQEGSASFLQHKYRQCDLQPIPLIFLTEGSKKDEAKFNAEAKHPHWSYLCLPSADQEIIEEINRVSGKSTDAKAAPVNVFSGPDQLTFNQVIGLMEASPEGRCRYQGCVLLLEARPDKQKELTFFLEDLGFEVWREISSELGWLRLLRDRPDLVIMSSVVEGEAGRRQFLADKNELELFEGLPFLFLVAGDENEIREMNEKVNEFTWGVVRFPASAEEIAQAIERLIP